MNDIFSISRRGLLQGAGALTLTFAIPSGVLAQAAKKLPVNLERNANLSSWIRVHADGKITLLIGKVVPSMRVVYFLKKAPKYSTVQYCSIKGKCWILQIK